MSLLPFVVSGVFSSSACKLEQGPKTYALVTMKHDETRIQMVAIMEVSGETLCETAVQQFMEGFREEQDSPDWRQTERSCQQTLEPIYQRVMNKEKFHATYLIISPRSSWEYEARIVLYGIPSSQAQPICDQVAKEMGERLDVEAECVQGTIG